MTDKPQDIPDVDCSKLSGRKREICTGRDADGQPITMAEGKRQAYIRRWFNLHEPADDEWLLGDMIAAALSAVGITKERVSDAMKRPCGCAARQEKLNRLHRWAIAAVRLPVAAARRGLEAILGSEPESDE